MAQPPSIRITANFDNNLVAIKDFLTANEMTTQFESLIDQLFETIIPNLQQFPCIGKNFLAQPPGSVEILSLLQKIKQRLPENASIRQYLNKDYSILYWQSDHQIVLLAIKHHRQLAFSIR